MPEFKEGDKVRYINNGHSSNTEWVGIEGTVESVNHNVRIKLTKTNDHVKNGPWTSYDVGACVNISPNKLEKIPSFGFGDIQIGDVIRRTRTNGGLTEICEGKVVSKDRWSARADVDAHGEITIGFPRDDNDERVTLELVSRPEPEPHWSEEVEVGAVGFADDGYLLKVFEKTGDNVWKVTYLDNNTVYDFSTTKELKEGYGAITSKDQIDWRKK